MNNPLGSVDPNRMEASFSAEHEIIEGWIGISQKILGHLMPAGFAYDKATGILPEKPMESLYAQK
jgi:hypothetical protein